MARETASAVGGTHSTGMHSCSEHWFVSKKRVTFYPPPPTLETSTEKQKQIDTIVLSNDHSQ